MCYIFKTEKHEFLGPEHGSALSFNLLWVLKSLL